jgi:hypothetical protein
MKVAKFLPVVVLMMLAAPALADLNYTVGAGGTFLTIGAALSQAQTDDSALTTPENVNITILDSASYPEVMAPSMHSAYVGTTWTIQAAPGQSPKVYAESSQTYGDGQSLAFLGLNFDPTISTGANKLVDNRTSNTNNLFQNCTFNVTSAVSGGGLLLGVVTNQNDTVNNCKFIVASGMRGIYMRGNGGVITVTHSYFDITAGSSGTNALGCGDDRAEAPVVFKNNIVNGNGRAISYGDNGAQPQLDMEFNTFYGYSGTEVVKVGNGVLTNPAWKIAGNLFWGQAFVGGTALETSTSADAVPNYYTFNNAFGNINGTKALTTWAGTSPDPITNLNNTPGCYGNVDIGDPTPNPTDPLTIFKSVTVGDPNYLVLINEEKGELYGFQAPEPMTLSLMVLGGLGLIARKRK